MASPALHTKSTSSSARAHLHAADADRRRPESGVLYRALQEHLETFLERRNQEERPVPGFVERELRRFLDCGILAHGFVLVRCTACKIARLVAFSCKCRGFCPSCGGRRMSDTAAHLVDRVFPRVPVRQWVLSLPYPLRFRLAYDPVLCTEVLGAYLRVLQRHMRRRARIQRGLSQAQSGAVSFIQRFGSAINLNVHFHSLVLDGVFTSSDSQAPEPAFHELDFPSDEDMAELVLDIAKAIVRLLRRKGWPDELGSGDVDPLADEQPLLAHVYAASLQNRIATGKRAGRPVMRFGQNLDLEAVEISPGKRTAKVEGFSLHANVSIAAHDRSALERLCRYTARPPIATQRLEPLPDGRIAYALKRPWTDGTTHVVFEPLELIEKLVALVPRPRKNLVRYHGILAPNAKFRSQVIPTPEIPSHCNEDAAPENDAAPAPRMPKPELIAATFTRPRHLRWAELMRRVFAKDVLTCPHCPGRVRIQTLIIDPKAIRSILESLNLPQRAPPIARARPRPEYEEDLG